MKTAPTLHTERLILRSFTLADAPDVQRISNDHDVSSMTQIVEYPCEDGMAEEWIEWSHKTFEKGERTHFAITLRTDGTLIGAVELQFRLHLPYDDAVLGYWIGKPYWNCGYATEAAKVVVAYGFRERDIDIILAYHFKRNPASGRVLQKIGMHYWDYFPKDHLHWGVWEDQIGYTISRSQFKEK